MIETTKQYYVYDPNEDTSMFFMTEEEQLGYAADCIDKYCDSGGWDEGVTNIIVGVVTHVVRKTNVIRRPPDSSISEEGFDPWSNYWPKGCKELCNYELARVI